MIRKAMTFAFLAWQAACGPAVPDTAKTQSNYPPNYTWGERCVESSVFRACQYRQGQYFALSVVYRGQLAFARELNLYVRLNGRDGTFSLPVYRDQRRSFLTNGYTDCRSRPSGNGWDCDRASPPMQDLFFYAAEYYWRLNAWDIELAAFDGEGNWDSNFGQNYRLRFEP